MECRRATSSASFALVRFLANHSENPGEESTPFLALFDYVSRAHEIAIRPSSVRPSVTSVISEHREVWISYMDFFRILLVGCTGLYARICFFLIKKCMFWFLLRFLFSFSLTWDPMGAKISKRYSSLISLLKFFKLLNFIPNRPHKSTVWDILNFANLKFNRLFQSSLTQDPIGNENFNTLLLLQIAFELFQTSLFSVVLIKVHFFGGDFWNFEFPIFSDLFEIHHCTLWANPKNLNYLENERPSSETKWNLGLGDEYSMYTIYVWNLSG